MNIFILNTFLFALIKFEKFWALYKHQSDLNLITSAAVQLTQLYEDGHFVSIKNQDAK